MKLDRRQFTGALIASLFLKRGWSNPVELPPCPDDYSWRRSLALEACVPCPPDWFFCEKDNDGAGSKTAYCTREDFQTTGEFLTGFAVNVVTGIDGNVSALCCVIVNACLEGITPMEVFHDVNEQYFTYGVEKINPPSGYHKTDWRIRIVGVANKMTNTLYLVQFESPADKWSRDWNIGQQIYEMFKINESV